jgi:hypothetical protein
MLKPQGRFDQLQFHDPQFAIIARDHIDAGIGGFCRRRGERG